MTAATPTTEPLACGRCKSPLEASDLRCAVCGLPTPTENALASAELVAQILRCNGCGAAVRYDASVRAPRCDFCHSVMEVETPDDPIEQAEFFVQFRTSPDAAKEALQSWLGRQGWFRPSDLASAATIDELKPLWWVGWIFDADVRVSWAADSDAGSRRSVWAPHSGGRELSLQNVIVPASRGLSEDECIALVPSYRVEDTAPDPKAVPSATVEEFAVQRSTARRLIARGLERVASVHATRDVPGTLTRNLSVAVLPTRLASRRFAFPAYVLAYRYRDKLYRAVIHGQDPAVIVGRTPLSLGKVAIAVCASVLALALVLGVIALIAGS